MDILVLSGGGVNGLVQLGVLQVLHEQSKLTNVSTFVGTSVGAIIGYLLMIGYSPLEVVRVLDSSPLFDQLSHLNLSNLLKLKGGVSFDPIREALGDLTMLKLGVRDLTLIDLQTLTGKTLICTTFNLTKYQDEYLSPATHANLFTSDALRMTSNLPLIFDRFQGESGDYYLDGCLVENFPIGMGRYVAESILEICDSQTPQVKVNELSVIGVNLSMAKPSHDDTSVPDLETYVSQLLHATSFVVGRKMAQRRDMAQNPRIREKVITVELDQATDGFRFGVDRVHRLDLFVRGYRYASSVYPPRSPLYAGG